MQGADNLNLSQPFPNDDLFTNRQGRIQGGAIGAMAPPPDPIEQNEKVYVITMSRKKFFEAKRHKKISHAERTISIRIDIMLNSMHNHTLRLSRAQRAAFALPSESESRTKTHEVVTLNEVCKHRIRRISSCYRLSRSGSANVARWAREYSCVRYFFVCKYNK